jgi:hypothetical protein
VPAAAQNGVCGNLAARIEQRCNDQTPIEIVLVQHRSLEVVAPEQGASVRQAARGRWA